MHYDDAATILVVEDDDATRTFLADNLTADGYELLVADCAQRRAAPAGDEVPRPRARRRRAARRLGARAPAPRARGRRPRRRGSTRALRSLAAHRPRRRARPRARLRARRGRLRLQALLLSGAARPRSARCCAARGRRRRSGACASATLEIDPPRARSRCAATRIELSQKEFALLRTLASEPTRVFTKEELLRDVWGFRALGTHAHARLARLPPAHEARRARRPVRDERLGRRLPAGRRGDAMTVAGWLVATALLVLAARLDRRARRRA